jgi:xanthine dehydrogenase accessory factor
MLELAGDLLPLLRSGAAVAAVTVAGVALSAPRGVGATMAVTAEGRVIGSISGGCVEGDAIVLAHSARVTGAAVTARLGFSDDAAHAAGLACGGSVDVVAYPLPSRDDAGFPAVEAELAAAAGGRAASVGVVTSGADAGRMLAPAQLRGVLPPASVGELTALGESRMLRGACAGADVLLVTSVPRARLILVGAGEHAAALCRVATAAGYAVEVCDVWPTLVTPERFPGAVRLVAELPHEYLASLDRSGLDDRTAVCVLTHDERVDVPALAAALSLPVGFVGAMGARSTVARRRELLEARGVDEEDLARLRSPVGLDLGGAGADETAVSVLAEIIAVRHGGSAAPLRDRTGPLHRRSPRAGDPCSGAASPVRAACEPGSSAVPLPTASPGAP